ncbi:transposase, partial [Candidatus Margulisiibacteriota bacterium]
RRNIAQLSDLLKKASEESKAELSFKFETAKTIYEQQLQMVKEKTCRIKDRIVSFHQPHIRPMVRGKDGKDVEFGPKLVLSWVDGFACLDKISSDGFNEGNFLKNSLKVYKRNFGQLPDEVIADKIFGNRHNRKLLERIKIKTAFKPLGRKTKESKKEEAYIKKKQKERNKIEGIIGTGKNHYGLDRIMYTIAGGEEIWTRLSLIGMNLTTAAKRLEPQTA